MPLEEGDQVLEEKPDETLPSRTSRRLQDQEKKDYSAMHKGDQLSEEARGASPVSQKDRKQQGRGESRKVKEKELSKKVDTDRMSDKDKSDFEHLLSEHFKGLEELDTHDMTKDSYKKLITGFSGLTKDLKKKLLKDESVEVEEDDSDDDSQFSSESSSLSESSSDSESDTDLDSKIKALEARKKRMKRKTESKKYEGKKKALKKLEVEVASLEREFTKNRNKKRPEMGSEKAKSRKIKNSKESKKLTSKKGKKGQ